MKLNHIIFVFFISLCLTGCAYSDKVDDAVCSTFDMYSLDINDTTYQDLDFLQHVLKDCQWVVLGEPLHNLGSSHLLKSKLVKYLHEKMGYNVLIFEAGQMEMDFVRYNLTSNDEEDLRIFKQALWHFWANANECQELFKYIKETQQSSTPMIIQGCDIQPTGSFSDSLRQIIIEDLLKKHNIQLADYPALSKALTDYRMVPYWKYQQSKQQTEQVCLDLEKLLRISELSKRDYLENILASIRLFNEFEELTSCRFQFRDSLMFERVISIKNKYPNQKYIIWVANLHALHNQTQYQSKADLLHFTTLGERLKEQLLNHLYTLCITGNIIADTSGRVIQRASRRSLEYFLHDKQIKTTFLNFRDSDSSYQSMQMHCNQGFGLYACWPNMTDGIIFIDTLKTFITYE